MNRELFDIDGDVATSGAEPFDGLFAVGRIRLAELSVHNRGSFNGLHTARIDPGGTLFTGDNGSGKTTLIDGLMALLLPSGKASFNVAAAQGDRTDRTLLSYMRGSFGAAHDGVATRVTSTREAGVVTGLRAMYRGGDGSTITLVALFWISQSTNALSDVRRCYAVAKRDLALVDVLHAFGEGNARAMKQWLRSDPAITCLDESFSDYQALYRQLLHMDNRNAPALLSRALGLKKIDDLTDLIRDLVLEPSTVRDDARTVVAEFADLVSVHDALVDARARRDALARLPELDATLRRTADAIRALQAERDGVAVHVARRALALWGRRVEALRAALADTRRELDEAEAASDGIGVRVERFHEAYLQLGGNQVETLKRDLEIAAGQLAATVAAASEYQRVAVELELPDALDEATFAANRTRAAEALAGLGADVERARDAFARASAALGAVQEATRRNRVDAAEIATRPDSNVDLRFQKLRDDLIDALGLEAGECRFLAELVDVRDEERAWQGAIERALGGLRTTLAVPESRFRAVTRWLNARHTGLHVRVQVVDASRVPGRPPEFLDAGFLRKLAWREHPWREWLKHHLRRFDLTCVDGTEALDATPFRQPSERGHLGADRRASGERARGARVARCGRARDRDRLRVSSWGRTPEEALAVLRRREWDDPARLRARLLGERTFPVRLPLGVPTGDRAIEDLSRFRRWVEDWRAFAHRACVEWEPRRLRRLGEQRVPVALTVSSMHQLADVLGPAALARTAAWEARLEPLLTLADPSRRATLYRALVRRLERVERLRPDEVALLVRLVPQLSSGLGRGAYLRALPLRGVDTKFVEAQGVLLTGVLDALHDGDVGAAGGLGAWLGCLESPEGWLTVRPLCETTRAALGDLPILQLPARHLSERALPAGRILVVENLQSGLALPELPGTVAVAGAGRNVAWLDAPWLQNLRVGYWGDVDSWGLQILAEARGRCAHLEPLMMDRRTLDAHRERAVPEPGSCVPDDARLTKEEVALSRELRAGGGALRLEQERLSMDWIRAELERWCRAVRPRSHDDLAPETIPRSRASSRATDGVR